MTIDKPSMQNSYCRQAPAQLLQVLQFEPPDALISALKAWNWAVDQTDESGLALLFRAVLLGRLDHAEVLLSAGANIDCQDSNGWTPLFWAVPYQDLQARGRSTADIYGTGPGPGNAPGSTAATSVYGW